MKMKELWVENDCFHAAFEVLNNLSMWVPALRI